MLRKDLINSGAITQQNYLDAQSDLQRLMKLQSAAKNEWDQAKQALVLLKSQEKNTSGTKRYRSNTVSAG